jgi:hypothetical protein
VFIPQIKKAVLKAKPSWIHNFKIATLTLEMYYGLHFQFRRALITREIPVYFGME